MRCRVIAFLFGINRNRYLRLVGGPHDGQRIPYEPSKGAFLKIAPSVAEAIAQIRRGGSLDSADAHVYQVWPAALEAHYVGPDRLVSKGVRRD